MKLSIPALLLSATLAHAATYTFTWTPSPDVTVEGYRFYGFTNSVAKANRVISAPASIDCTFTWSNIPPGTYFVILTATNVLGNESDPSPAVSFQVLTPPSNVSYLQLKLFAWLESSCEAEGEYAYLWSLGESAIPVSEDDQFFRVKVAIER
ncbi:MAG: hypothetical protein ABFD89_03860 [Bryobacteraceae bacterium]